MPLASNVNFEQGQIVSNGLIVKLGAGGALTIYSSVAADIVVDVTGAFVPAARRRRDASWPPTLSACSTRAPAPRWRPEA